MKKNKKQERQHYYLKAEHIMKILKYQRDNPQGSPYIQTLRKLKKESNTNEKQGFGPSLLLFKMPDYLKKEMRKIRISHLLVLKTVSKRSDFPKKTDSGLTASVRNCSEPVKRGTRSGLNQ